MTPSTVEPKGNSPTETTTSSSSPKDGWLFAGLASSFPNITDASENWFKLVWPQPCSDGSKVPGCKVFHPQQDAEAREIPADDAVIEDSWVRKEQVMVFQYKGHFHAVDHGCPHRAYSLTWGAPFDIEDAGEIIGYALRCRGHGYAFELSTGIGDTGGYRLGVWDLELRALPEGGDEKEVWVRRPRKAS